MTKSNKSLLLWGSVILGIIVLVVLLAMFGNNTSPGSSTSLSVGVNSEDHTKGAENPKVTIVEYSDFQCPGCAGSYPMLKQLVEAFPNDVSFTYRHYPLLQLHANAELAGQASESAGLQGKFWDMHDVIFNTQTQWSGLEDPTEFFTTLAESIGLDTEQFATDLTSNEVKKRVAKNLTEATSMRLPGTPSFFLNGSLIEHPGSYAGFKSLIDAELAR
ncbi:MAG: disulfide bond formation protein DsbA [Candidatus Magasanikbacteria bacterium CG11_big_fil_rev_8_21_14_0_20_43_7]|uniref:Disulfide bond formation protein DsbA n=1 Tax=Candidatus Magasanikbacteria bacterium CG11_big_fil_rev_8_21_14_0_20_43_7 TaxID=1974654 RepID=A0A2H0N2E3_9BACT|nr:MAG: disulfide bond formation protein DsbA [Candidatus Magasanikbacteria bacterium CG11_big_fil_rev_8_21_14_0_20_43_7]